MWRRFSTGVLLVTALGLIVTACGAPRDPGTAPRVLSVSIDQADLTLDVGESEALTATVVVEGGASDDVLWGSDAPDVATVDANGLVTAVDVGEALITAVSVFDSSRSDSITVTVLGSAQGVLSVSIDQADLTLDVGESEALTATVVVEGGASDAVLWGSDAPAVATVDSTGVVTAVGVGTAVITAVSVVDSTRSDSITVTVLGGVDFVVDAQAETLDPAALATFTVGGGETVMVEVDFPSSGADLMYVEIEPSEATTDLRIELRGERAGDLELVSRSPSIFATSVAALSLAAVPAAVERSAISVEWNCFGPCVARPYRQGTSYVRVINEDAAALSVTLYAYGFVAADENEPNDTFETATEVVAMNVDDTVTGAIEHVEDLDYFRIACDDGFPFGDVRLELTSSFEGDIVLVADDNVYPPDVETPALDCGTTVFVHTTDGTAGPSADSRYTITIR